MDPVDPDFLHQVFNTWVIGSLQGLCPNMSQLGSQLNQLSLQLSTPTPTTLAPVSNPPSSHHARPTKPPLALFPGSILPPPSSCQVSPCL